LNSKDKGYEAESIALEYLCKKGLKLLERNFLIRAGEIDLIMHDGESIIFVEVRYRKESDFGDGAASVTKAKQRKLGRTALAYLQKHKKNNEYCRFDVISITKDLHSPSTIDWIKNAFDYAG
jgi:putative endonuclease